MGIPTLDKRSGRPIQVFSPDSISASLTTHSVSDVLAVRTTTDGTYYINSVSGVTAAVLAGTVIGIGTNVSQLVFSSGQILEIMDK